MPSKAETTPKLNAKAGVFSAQPLPIVTGKWDSLLPRKAIYMTNGHLLVTSSADLRTCWTNWHDYFSPLGFLKKELSFFSEAEEYLDSTAAFFFLFLGPPFVAYVSSQARGQIRATAARLRHSHSNAGSRTHWARPGIKSETSWFLVRFISSLSQQELLECIILYSQLYS